MMKSTF